MHLYRHCYYVALQDHLRPSGDDKNAAYSTGQSRKSRESLTVYQARSQALEETDMSRNSALT